MRLELPGREPTVLVFDPRVAEQVYRREGMFPTRPAFYSLRAAKERDGEAPELQGMLTSNGEHWKTTRRCAQGHLLQPGLAKRFLPQVWNISEQFAEQLGANLCISERGTCGTVRNFEEEAYRWALESIASIALNKKLGSISSSSPDPECLEMIKERNISDSNSSIFKPNFELLLTLVLISVFKSVISFSKLRMDECNF